jgi:hypothetical protein
MIYGPVYANTAARWRPCFLAMKRNALCAREVCHLEEGGGEAEMWLISWCLLLSPFFSKELVPEEVSLLPSPKEDVR